MVKNKYFVYKYNKYIYYYFNKANRLSVTSPLFLGKIGLSFYFIQQQKKYYIFKK